MAHSLSRRPVRRVFLVLTAATALVGAAVTPAQAAGHGAPQRVASGLDNPR